MAQNYVGHKVLLRRGNFYNKRPLDASRKSKKSGLNSNSDKFSHIDKYVSAVISGEIKKEPIVGFPSP